MILATASEMYAGGPGSGCNPEAGKCGRPSGSGEGKATVYHGTSLEASKKILKEGLRPQEGGLKSVYFSDDKRTAAMFAKASGENFAVRNHITGEDVNKVEVGIIVVSDAQKAGLSQAYSSHYTADKVSARYISRVEVYKLGDIRSVLEKAVPVRIVKRGVSAAAIPVKVYAAVVFSGK